MGKRALGLWCAVAAALASQAWADQPASDAEHESEFDSASSGRRSAIASPRSPALRAIRACTTPVRPPAGCGSRATAAIAGRRSSTSNRGGDRRARGRALRAQHGVGGHRRGLGDSRQRRHGQRNLQVHRCRQYLGQHGPARVRPNRPHHRASGESRHRLRLRAGAGDRTAAGARRLPHHRRRRALGARTVRRRERRLLGSVAGCARPAHPDRRHVAGGDAHLGRVERRPRQRNVYLPRRRNDMAAPGGTRPAAFAARQDRRRDRADQFQAHLRADPDERPGLGVALG